MARPSPAPSGNSSTIFHQHFNMHPGTFSTPSSSPSPDKSLSVPSSRTSLEIQEDKCPAQTQKTASKPSQQCSRSNKSQQETGGHQETDVEGYYTKTWEQLLEEVCGQHRAMALRDGQLNTVCGLMKKAGGPQRAPHLTAEENGESSVPSRSSMPTTNGSENPSKKNASSGVAPPNLPNDSSRSGPSTARPQSQKASSLPPLQTKLKAEAAQIDIEALKREAREPSSAETSDREDDDADQRTPRGSFRPGISATAHKGRGKGKAQSGNLEEDRSMKKLMDTCFGLRSQWDEQKTQGAEKAKSLYGRERRDVDRKARASDAAMQDLMDSLEELMESWDEYMIAVDGGNGVEE